MAVRYSHEVANYRLGCFVRMLFSGVDRNPALGSKPKSVFCDNCLVIVSNIDFKLDALHFVPSERSTEKNRKILTYLVK
ncbi:hypothetical protein E2C01_004758 [Portunus trituberculatus]|uniref:Uncharacterized protein n=1 Tax=Portunus trituberculatus TaxID=210409 RepID=A0A5B7CT69_PORTR|nr:hypothetical protein [Portunus trituberculatus]